MNSALPRIAGAPAAPGTLDEAPEPGAIVEYLEALRAWQRDVHELLGTIDSMDGGASKGRDDATRADLTLAFAMWNTVEIRVAEIVRVWDSGRVGVEERQQIARLIWGRLDGQVHADVAVNLVEVVSLTAALAERLHAKLDDTERDALRLRELEDRARSLAHDRREVEELVARCSERITPAPFVELPPVADLAVIMIMDSAARAACSQRLDAVASALGDARATCETLLARRASLRGLAEAYHDMAAERGHAEDAQLAKQWSALRSRLWSAPCDLDAAAAELADYQRAVRGS